MNDVKTTFNKTYKLYKENLTNPLFWAIMSNIEVVPSAIVPSIMADTYNFYTKWENVNKQEEIEWSKMLSEAKNISKKYNNCDFAKRVLLVIVERLEQDFKAEGSKN